MMSLPVLQTRAEPPPPCFGTDLWNPKEVECAGGADPTYTNKETNSHVRDRCRFFDQCGAKGQALKAQRQLPQTMFPPLSQIPQMRPMVSAAAVRAQVPQMSQPMMPPRYVQQPAQVPQVPGAWHPAPTYQFNHGIPNYLTVPEPRLPGESIWVTLFRGLLRSVFKSMGHTMSYFFDTTTMQKEPPPPPPGG